MGKEFNHDSKNLNEFIRRNAGKKYLTNWQVLVLRFLKREKSFL